MTRTKEIRQYAFRNDSAFEIPPYGCLSVTDTIDEENEVVYLVRRPEYEDEQLQDPARLVFNLGEYIAAGDYGRCSSAMPLQALCESTVVTGNIVGPVENSFVMGPLGNAFIVKTQDNTIPHVEGTAQVWLVEPNIAETAVVEITSAVADADGYYPANVVRFDTATKSWSTVRACRVKNAN